MACQGGRHERRSGEWIVISVTLKRYDNEKREQERNLQSQQSPHNQGLQFLFNNSHLNDDVIWKQQIISPALFDTPLYLSCGFP